MLCHSCGCPTCIILAGSPVQSTELPLPSSELMTTNRAATDPEVAHSRNVIDFAERKVSLMQAAAAMVDFTKQTTSVGRVIEMHKAAISPLKTFPPELLVVIFTEYLSMMKDPWLGLVSPASLLGLMQICSWWRRVVLDTPQFWTKISDSTPMVDLWLNRSKELPLDLHFDLPSGNIVWALGALIPQAHRWEQVYFTLQSNSNYILSPVRGRLRSLKRLRLSCLNTTGVLDFCEEAPQLTEIHLERVPNPLAIKLPWGQLRECTLGGSLITLYTLHRAENLQTCHLLMDDCIPWSWPIPHIHHSKLHTLIIPYWHANNTPIDSFFSSLTLLSLQILKLRFSTYGIYPEPVDPPLFKFFQRSALHLTGLKLANIPFSPGNLIKCLMLMPSLASLDIMFVHGGFYSISDDFLGRLSLSRPGRLIPRLSSLTLRGQASFGEQSLDDFIASRRGIEPRDARISLLANLALDCTAPGDWSQWEPPLFHRFVSEGLNILYGVDWDIEHPDMDVTDLGKCEPGYSDI